MFPGEKKGMIISIQTTTREKAPNGERFDDKQADWTEESHNSRLEL
jgi:hypothetical protein